MGNLIKVVLLLGGSFVQFTLDEYNRMWNKNCVKMSKQTAWGWWLFVLYNTSHCSGQGRMRFVRAVRYRTLRYLVEWKRKRKRYSFYAGFERVGGGLRFRDIMTVCFYLGAPVRLFFITLALLYSKNNNNYLHSVLSLFFALYYFFHLFDVSYRQCKVCNDGVCTAVCE